MYKGTMSLVLNRHMRLIAAMGQVSKNGGIRPTKSAKRKQLIAEMIERKIILSEKINGLHPLTLSGLKAFLTLGYTRPLLTKKLKLREYHLQLSQMINPETVAIPIKDKAAFYYWCVDNDVCAFPSILTIEDYSKIDYRINYKWPISFFSIDSDDIPLVKLRWC